MSVRRLPGKGWLVLIGGGEFSFGETLGVDQVWLEKVPEGPIGFLPTASGSTDYGHHFAEYLSASFERETVTVPIYRPRDARRQKNLDRIDQCAAIYLGGGVTDHLADTLLASPAMEALGRKLGSGGIVVAIAAAAQILGQRARSMFGGESLAGAAWLPGGAVESNFDPGHDRRLRQLMADEGVQWGLGLPAGSALLLGPDNQLQYVGTSFLLEDADGDFQVLHG